MSIRLFVTLLRSHDSDIEYKKLMLMVERTCKISMLKRKIEQEFAELFPGERPFVCGKLEDQYGYSLSNFSLVEELLKHDDRCVAVPEAIGGTFAAANDPREMLMMLKTLTQSITLKLSDGPLHTFSQIEELLRTVLPLAFSGDRETVKNVAIILLKVAHHDTFLLLESRSMSALLNLYVLAVQYWVLELVSNDAELQRITLDLLDKVSACTAFAATFRTNTVMSKLMNLSTYVQGQARIRIVKLVGVFSKVQAVESKFDTGMLKGTEGPKSPDHPRTQPRQVEASRTDTYQSATRQPEMRRNESYLSTIPRQSEPVRQSVTDVSRAAYREPEARRSRYQEPPREQTYETTDYSRTRKAEPQEPQAERARQPTPHYYADQSEDQITRIISDYIDMLTPGNSTEMVVFALQSIDQGLNESIDIVMHEPILFVKILNLIELVTPANVHEIHKRVLSTLASKMNSARAKDAIQKSVIPRALKAHKTQASILQSVILDLLESILKQGKSACDVPSLISVALSTIARINELGMSILAEVAEPSNRDIPDTQFENHLPFIINACRSAAGSKDYQNIATKCLGSLCLREYLRPLIIYSGGLELLIGMVRNESNLEGQRLAAKALVNLTATKQDARLRVLAELSNEIKRLYRNDIDSIVGAYLQTLIAGER
mmetsp:Transcript_20330/g.37956  ORF Transcript_20330/g.37956 Transcript_20330/m.37956 type:complete len:663 (+) Transcript_20330:3853-5841(+)